MLTAECRHFCEYRRESREVCVSSDCDLGRGWGSAGLSGCARPSVRPCRWHVRPCTCLPLASLETLGLSHSRRPVGQIDGPRFKCGLPPRGACSAVRCQHEHTFEIIRAMTTFQKKKNLKTRKRKEKPTITSSPYWQFLY